MDIPSVQAAERSVRHHFDARPAASDEPCYGANHDPSVPWWRVASPARTTAAPQNVYWRHASSTSLCSRRYSTDRDRSKYIVTSVNIQP